MREVLKFYLNLSNTERTVLLGLAKDMEVKGNYEIALLYKTRDERRKWIKIIVSGYSETCMKEVPEIG